MNQGKARSHLVIQAIGLIYAAYLMVSLISDYCNGESPLTLLPFCLLIAVMAGIELALGWWAWRSWRRDRESEQADEERNGSDMGE